MDMHALLLPIFLDHIGSASIVPFVPSVTLEAMRLFGGYVLTGLPAAAAVAGSVVGCGLNWLLGRILVWIRMKMPQLDTHSFPATERFFTRYGFALAAFYWLPLGSIILVVAGLFRAPLWKVLLAATIGAAMHIATQVS
jgi:membrane protein YqaA with SNARE-associated domain